MELVCPKCQGAMRQYERNGITVDQCSECRGIFLDRGELEQMVNAENSWHGGSQSAPPPPAAPPAPGYGDRSYSDHGYRSRYPQGHGSHKPRKQRSFLGDLFG